jgi:hypothetical protein
VLSLPSFNTGRFNKGYFIKFGSISAASGFTGASSAGNKVGRTLSMILMMWKSGV